MLSLPKGILPLKSGILNFVAELGVPKLVPITANNCGYNDLSYSDPSHSNQKLGAAAPPNGVIIPVGICAMAEKKLSLLILYNPVLPETLLINISSLF
jgi:hypothetical protein